MQKITLYLSSTQTDTVKKMAKQMDIKFAELIRRAIDSYLDNTVRKTKALGAWNYGPMVLDADDATFNRTTRKKND